MSWPFSPDGGRGKVLVALVHVKFLDGEAVDPPNGHLRSLTRPGFLCRVLRNGVFLRTQLGRSSLKHQHHLAIRAI